MDEHLLIDTTDKLTLVEPFRNIYWRMRPSSARNSSAEQTVIPSFYSDLIIILNGGLTVFGRKVGESFVAPVLLNSLTVRFSEDACMFGIRMHPLVLRVLLKGLPSDMFQGPNRLECFLPAGLTENLLNILKQTGEFEQQANEVNDCFHEILRGRLDGDSLIISDCLEMVVREPGMKVGELARRSGISERWLEKLFSRYLGFGPVKALQIARLNKFLRLVKEGEFQNLAEAGYCAGYYDQSHLNRDIKRLTGHTPKTFLKKFPMFIKIMNDV